MVFLLWGLQVVISSMYQKAILEICYMRAIQECLEWNHLLDWHWHWIPCQVLCELCWDCSRSHNKDTITSIRFSSQAIAMSKLWFCRAISKQMWILLIDAYSKWPEVHVMESTTTDIVIKHLQQIFATHGLPHQIVSNNGPQFTTKNFKPFLFVS